MVVPWGYFLDAKNHKPPTFSRKIRGLRFQNVAVKERFELSHITTGRLLPLARGIKRPILLKKSVRPNGLNIGR